MSFYLDDALQSITHLQSSVIPKSIRDVRHQRLPPRQFQLPRKLPMLSSEKMVEFQRFLESDINNEVEISLGTYHGERFISGVQLVQFHRLLEFMRKQGSVTQEPIENTKEYRNGFLRKIIYEDGSVTYQKKQRQFTLDSKEWFFRVRNSKEINIFDPTEEEKESVEFGKDVLKKGTIIEEPNNKIIRFKTRHSFIGYENNIFDGIRVDLTFVIQDNGIHVRKVYEAEFERTIKGIDHARFLRIIRLMLMICQDVLESPPIWKKKSQELILAGENRLMSNSEMNQVSRSYNNLFNSDIRRRQIGMHPGQFFEFKNKPRAMKISDLLDASSFAITIKYDGLRKFLYIGDYGSYFVEPRYAVQKLNGHPIELRGTLLDGELMTHETLHSFYVFDILFYKGLDVRPNNLHERLDYVQQATDQLTFQEFAIFPKKFFMSDNFYESAASANTEKEIVEENGIPTDGWVLQPKYLPYRNERTLKWKPADLLTIDFYLEHTGSNRYLLYIKSQKNLEIFRGTSYTPFSGSVKISSDFAPEDLNAHIVEMKWENDTFIPLRVRYDRQDPNFKDWAVDLWKDIQNPIPKQTLLGSDLRVVRSWFNKIKKGIINTTVRNSEILLDVGSGRGGDLAKWKAKNLYVFAVEPDKEVIKEMKKRQINMKYKQVYYIPAGIERTDLITMFMKEKTKNTGGITWKADNATAFFSLQFLGESEEKMDAMVNTLRKTLKTNSRVVGIVMDGEKIEDMLSTNDEYVSSSGAWSIQKKGDWPFSPFGKRVIVNIADPSSMVHNVEEYLFDFDEFSAKMKRSGFVLENSKTYSPPSQLPSDSKKWAQMQRFFSFRKEDKIAFNNLPALGVDQIASFDSVFGKEKLMRIGTVGEGSCFFHAILRSFSKRYIAMNPEDKTEDILRVQKRELEAIRGEPHFREMAMKIKEKFKRRAEQRRNVEKKRMEFVSRIRKNLASRLTLSIYKELGGGILAEVMTQRYEKRARTPEVAEKLGWAIYLQKLSDCSEWVGEEAIEYVSNTLGIDIYIMRDTTRDVYLLGADCNRIYKGRPSVVLLNLDNIHYETVGRMQTDGRLQTLFNHNDPWIQKLNRKLCA